MRYVVQAAVDLLPAVCFPHCWKLLWLSNDLCEQCIEAIGSALCQVTGVRHQPVVADVLLVN